MWVLKAVPGAGPAGSDPEMLCSLKISRLNSQNENSGHPRRQNSHPAQLRSGSSTARVEASLGGEQ